MRDRHVDGAAAGGTPPAQDDAVDGLAWGSSCRPMDQIDWSRLATHILGAEHAVIVGVVPSTLLKKLGEARDGGAPVIAVDLAYLTPVPDLAPYTLPGAAQSYARWWLAGVKGMTRLINAISGSLGRVDSQVKGIPFLFLDCLIKCDFTGGSSEFFLLTGLPARGGNSRAGHVLTSMLDDADGKVAEWIQSLSTVAEPVVLREVHCLRATPIPRESVDFTSLAWEISGLGRYGDEGQRGSALMPVAIVVPRYNHYGEWGVVLHKRDWHSNESELDVLSLPSARVQDTDVARAYRFAPPRSQLNDEEALMEFWRVSGRRPPLAVTGDAFINAAQRAVAFTLGFPVDAQRLEFRGLQVREDADDASRVGYAVFTLDLAVDGAHDEVRTVLKNSSAEMCSMPVARLYPEAAPPKLPLPLNHLLKHQGPWLMEHCFAGKPSGAVTP